MGYLVLENGKVFEGRLIGSKKDVIGEVVFNTGMTGYEETISDPSYYGQMVTMTYPLIGNYGVNGEDVESAKPQIRALIVRELCDFPSNWRAERDLNSWLIEYGVSGIQGIDTRDLTRTIRYKGTMNGIICQNMPTEEQMEKVKAYTIKDAVEKVSVKCPYRIKGSGKKVAVIDYGLKRNILNCLTNRNLDLTVFPHDVSSKEILEGGFDGLMLTNGPGDPKENKKAIQTIKELLGKIPIFGICLGHQLVALAQGGNTEKLKYGHRGSNHPVKNTDSGKMYITSQNHSYAVMEKGLPKGGKVTFINWNDKTVEGVNYDDNSFTVQFHPEASAGPNDAGYLFDEFIKMMG